MGNPSWHSKPCAESERPKSECTCRCKTTLHGILAKTRTEDSSSIREAPDFREKEPHKKKARRTAVVAAALTVAGTVGGPRPFQDHDVSPRMVNGRSM
jgi:hypothetical protein